MTRVRRNDPKYLAYGPQLGDRLQLSHSQQNMVGLSGNSTAVRLDVQHNELIEISLQLVYMDQHHSLEDWPTQEDRGSRWLSPLCYFWSDTSA